MILIFLHSLESNEWMRSASETFFNLSLILGVALTSIDTQSCLVLSMQ